MILGADERWNELEKEVVDMSIGVNPAAVTVMDAFNASFLSGNGSSSPFGLLPVSLVEEDWISNEGNTNL